MTRSSTFSFAAAAVLASLSSSAAPAYQMNSYIDAPFGVTNAQPQQADGARKKATPAQRRAIARARAAAKERLAEKKRDDRSKSPAAPMIIIPPTPDVATSGAFVSTGAITTATVDGAEGAVTGSVKTPAPHQAKRVCRKFSAAVGGIIEVPCR